MVRTKTPKNPKTIRDYWKKTSASYREKKRKEEDHKLHNYVFQPKLSLSEKHQNNKFKVVSNNQQR